MLRVVFPATTAILSTVLYATAVRLVRLVWQVREERVRIVCPTVKVALLGGIWWGPTVLPVLFL